MSSSNKPIRKKKKTSKLLKKVMPDKYEELKKQMAQKEFNKTQNDLVKQIAQTRNRVKKIEGKVGPRTQTLNKLMKQVKSQNVDVRKFMAKGGKKSPSKSSG